jgi:3-hydroxybutyryl-CoA dehydrogenase
VDRGIASPEDVDRVARLTFGLRLPVMGPLENMDVVGLDLVARIHRYLLADLSGSAEPQPPLAERVAEGRLGVKSGSGFYDWNTRSARKLIEERDQQIVRQVAYLKDVKAL